MGNVIENGNYCVYVHTSPSGKKYVGQTCQKPEQRWKNGNGYLNNVYFTRAILKYGWDNFEHEIIASNLTKEEADNFEKLLIKKLNTLNPNGYNAKDGGSNGRPSEETKEKMSKSISGKKHSEETREKLREANLGKRLSEETKIKIGNASRGRCHSEGFKKWLSESRKGDKHPFYGKHLSEEHRAKISNAINGENHPMYGKNHSEESKKKISESCKGLNAGINNYKSKKIAQYDLNGSFIRFWNSMGEAERETGVSHGGISQCCNGKRKTAGGFIWKYYRDVEEDTEKEVI